MAFLVVVEVVVVVAMVVVVVGRGLEGLEGFGAVFVRSQLVSAK